jgi:hypothetical protein
MLYLCGFWRFANAYLREKEKRRSRKRVERSDRLQLKEQGQVDRRGRRS